MKRIPVPVLGLALALLAGACTDLPTRATTSADGLSPAFNTSATVTVTNSGGTPLVSWDAVPGATSYTVRFATTWFFTIYTRGDGTRRTFRTDLGTTTGTSYLDTSHTYSGDISCTRPAGEPYGPNDTYTEIYEYVVISHFPDGTTTTGRAYAPVGECY